MKKNVFGFLTDVRKLAIVALLIGVCLAIRSLATIEVTPLFKIDIGAVAIIFSIGILFGPVAGATAGLLTDVLSFFIKPTGMYNPFITIGFIIYGLIAGIAFFWKTDESTKARLWLIEILSTIAYILGFIIITLGIAWAFSANPDPAKQTSFGTALGVVLVGRLFSLLHIFWYLILTPTLVTVGKRMMSGWDQ